MSKKPTHEELEQQIKKHDDEFLAKNSAEKDLERIFNLSLDMIGSGNLEGYFTKINSSFKELLGYSENEFLNKPFISFVHQEDVEKTAKALANAGKGKKAISIENRYKCKDGSFKWIEWRVQTLLEENSFIAVGRDISERKQIEEELINHRNHLEEQVAERTKDLHNINKELRAEISERKQAEEELKRSNDQLTVFKQFAEESNQGMGWADLEGRIVYINSTLSHMFGVQKPEDVYGKLVQSTFYPESIEKRLKEVIFPTVIKEGKWQGESEIRTEDEKSIPTYESLFVIKDKDRNPLYFGNVLSDITERKQAEEALRESENRYNALFTGITDAILAHHITDDGLPGSFIEVNDIACCMLGYTRDELIGMGISDIDAPESTVDTHNIVEELKAGQDVLFEQILVAKDKRRIPVEVHAQVFDFRGSPAVFSTVRDITDRKLAEEALLSEKWLVDEYINSLPGLFYVFDENQLVKWNKEWERVSGYSADEISQMYGTDLFEGLDKTIIADRMMKVFVDGIADAEAEIVTKQGKRIPYYFTGLRKEFSGKPHLVGLGIDITARKRAEEEKAKLEAQLRQAHKIEAIGTLAGGIAHDFNNILGIIVGNTELSLGDVPKWNPAYQYLKEVQKACLRARDVVRQLLSFSRKSEQQKMPVMIAPIIKETSMLLRASIPSNIDIRYNIPDDPGNIMADPTQIHQVVLNLCTNAADAIAGQDGVLEISLDSTALDEKAAAQHEDLAPGPYVRLSVSDNGQGIGPSEIARIFDPYFTTKEVGKGTGLGLSVVHGIVKSHKGEIKVHSAPGKGTTFVIFFPMVEEEAEKPPAVREKPPRGNERILFVDDEDAMAKLGKKGLERLGYLVTAATSARKAIALFRADPDGFDLVISDMTMPEMTGDKLAKEIMETRPGMPVILCTGYSEHITEDKARDMGISAFVMKPVLGKEMAVTIRQVLGNAKEGIAPSAGSILVVDDEEQMRSMIRNILENAGYAVMEAPDGKVALWIHKGQPADLIITDILMLKKEGIETIIELKQGFPDVKIIALSGGEQGDKGRYLDIARKMGANNTLAKPFEKEELLKVVKELLG